MMKVKNHSGDQLALVELLFVEVLLGSFLASPACD